MVPQVAIKVWDVAGRYGEEAFAQGVSDDARSFASSLTAAVLRRELRLRSRRLAGRHGHGHVGGADPLARRRRRRAGPAFGMLVLASPDPQRFQSGMGTDFLERIAELASAACRGCARRAMRPWRAGPPEGARPPRGSDGSPKRGGHWSSATWSMCGSKNGSRLARWNSMRSTFKNSLKTPPRRAWNSRGCRTRTCAAGWRRCTAPAAAAAASRSSCRAGAASTCGWAGKAWWTAIRCRTCAPPRRPSRCPRP